MTLEEFRAYILLRKRGLPQKTVKRSSSKAKLEYDRMCAAIGLLGSRAFGELQGSKATAKTKTYDANFVDTPTETEDNPGEGAFMTNHGSDVDHGEYDIDDTLLEILVAQEDADALVVSSFEGELESLFQETPELHSALVSYLDARQRLRECLFQEIFEGQEGFLVQGSAAAEDC